mmetsp:Transcript_15814/g.37307  ORF Transcript_15814/g.37307 Transcript_15814/m.37307 type:complete len:224 (+) Transcript_15814:86-757(+)
MSETRASVLQPVPDDIKVGARVQALGKLMGTVKFIGMTQFAAGPWIGIELDTPDGKNDGTVHGERYFESKPGHGIFARPPAVRTMESLNAFAMPGEVPEATPPSSPSAIPIAQSPDSSPGGWQRRQSVELDLRNDICVVDRVDLVGIMSGCAEEIGTLQEAVDELLAKSSATGKQTGAEASEPLSPEEEDWLDAAATTITRNLEDKLTTLLDQKLAAALAAKS